MKAKVLFALLVAACSGCFIGASVSHVRWTDDEARAWLASKWAEHCKATGSWSNNVIFPYGIDTNWSICALSDGTKIELGFRDDGIVVWRGKSK